MKNKEVHVDPVLVVIIKLPFPPLNSCVIWKCLWRKALNVVSHFISLKENFLLLQFITRGLL